MSAVEPRPCACCGEIAVIRAEMDALDRGLIDVGVTAARALDKANAVEAGLASAFRAAGVDDDPAAICARSRRRRIEESGLRLVPGGMS